MAEEQVVEINVALIGNGGVGKTSIVDRYMTNSFTVTGRNDTGLVTDKVMDVVVEGHRVRLRFLDATGGHCITTIGASFARLAHGIMLVFDVSNYETFSAISKWISTVQEHVGKERTYDALLVGNKIDKERRQVTGDEVRTWMKEIGWERYMEVSAEDGTNIKTAVDSLIRRALGKKGLFRSQNTRGKFVLGGSGTLSGCGCCPIN